MCAETKRPLIVAHRGASADAPENTLPAFKLAWKQGADAIEGDFRLTADGKVVCIHDPDTVCTSVERHIVADTELDILRRMDARIPILREVLATVPPGRGIFIELKAGMEMLPAVIRAVDSSGLNASQVVVISFDADVVAEVKRLRRSWKVLWLTKTRLRFPGCCIEPTTEEIIDRLHRHGVDGVGLRAHPLMPGSFVRKIRAAGFDVHIWTVDNVWQARRYQRMGVQSLTTNMPARMVAALR